MNVELIAAALTGFIITITVSYLIFRRLPKKLKTTTYVDKWKIIQAHCKDKAEWQQALIEADNLLDKALQQRKFKGKSMGERMVSAQRVFTNNDGMWFAHNLYKKIHADPTTKLKEADMKAALVGFRQSLRDLGALSDGQSKNS